MEAFWHRLGGVTRIRFQVASREKSVGCSGTGNGNVEILAINNRVLVLTESGNWTMDSGTRLLFWNRYRWTFKPEPERILLEHLRYGAHAPVRLLTFDACKENCLVPSKPYLCGQDSYRATLKLTSQALILSWYISGPEKNQETIREYR